MAAVVILLQILLRGVEGIGVLHGEFAHADHTGAGSCLVAEFGLNLVDHEGIFGVGGGVVAHQMNGGFLMSHAQHHRGAVAVLEAEQLALNGIVAS